MSNMTDAEIKKGLKKYIDFTLECYERYKRAWSNETDKPTEDGIESMTNALDLINRQQATINRLKAESKNCGAKIQNQREQLKACNEKIKEQQAEIERLEASIKEVNEYLSQGDFAKGIALVYRLVKEMGRGCVG